MDTTPTAKRGRPAKNSVSGAMNATQRKREQRIRQAEAIQERDSSEWTEAECLSVLNGKRWREGAIDKAAWQQLGKLRGFM